jgi:D-alanyl-D-alanine carboxypeptidase
METPDESAPENEVELVMPDITDWQQPPRRPHRLFLLVLAILAVGGPDGTLDKRFLDDLRGRVFAKSGFVNNVSCLSGYLKARDDQWYAFSILMNGTGYGAKQLQERVVKAIDTSTIKTR